MFTVDIEVTNRCNADCHFCPRDQTPHEGLMTEPIFDRALARASEFREELGRTGLEDPAVQVGLCGLGEPLINPRTPQWVSAVKEAGFSCSVSSNAALLDERRGQALLDAGLDLILINVGDIGEAYEQVYKLPWQRTHDNIVRFAEMAKGRCDVGIALVDYKQDAAYADELERFWRERGISRFFKYDIMNRGGSLFVDHMQFEALPELQTARDLISRKGGRAICATPFVYVFVGYDGKYYLCCSDWKKEVSFGTIFERSILELTRDKLEHVLARGTVCSHVQPRPAQPADRRDARCPVAGRRRVRCGGHGPREGAAQPAARGNARGHGSGRDRRPPGDRAEAAEADPAPGQVTSGVSSAMSVG